AHYQSCTLQLHLQRDASYETPFVDHASYETPFVDQVDLGATTPTTAWDSAASAGA
ncbi:hypothetical protein NDU88_003249, partial [Pleurodeles waltl]